MDISIFGLLANFAIILPLLFALYLIVTRLRLAYVDKKTLNNGCILTSLVSFLSFIILSYFIYKNGFNLNQEFNFVTLERFSLDFGIVVDDTNIFYLIFASFLNLIVSVYSKYYFLAKKQFIFTKRRYYAFLSIVSFIAYLFLASSNLFLGTILLVLQAIVVFVFCYFDIFKNPTNANLTRFNRISLFGNFSLFFAVLILFRYAILSEGYVESFSLRYDELNTLISYTYGISSEYEFKLMTICLIVAIMSRFMIFPFSCYYSFLANSSNLTYLTVAILINNSIGMLLLDKFAPLLELLKENVVYLEVFIAFGVLISLLQLFFEKNIKIIFGYLLAISNSIIFVAFLNFNTSYVTYSFFIVNTIFIIILMMLFSYDKANLKKRLINKQVGFILEKSHIVLFEYLPNFVSKTFDFIDTKIIQNISYFFVKSIDIFASLSVYKINRINVIKNVRNILLVIALFTLLAIFIALFGRFE